MTLPWLGEKEGRSMPDLMTAALDAVGLARQRVLDLRIELAQQRDSCLTWAELTEKLKAEDGDGES